MPTNTQPTFLLLRGLVREQRHWGTFPELLIEQCPEYKQLMLDIPGNGQWYQSESPRTIAGMTESLRQQIDAQGLRGPFIPLALSMGGMIALDWMQRYPHEITAGVVVNTSLSNFSPFYRRLRWQCYGEFFRLFRQNPAQRELTILGFISNHQRDNAALLAQWQAWQQETPVAPHNALNQIIASARFTMSQKPVQPLLIVSAKADRMVDPSCSVKIQQAWHCAFAEHPSAGHDLPLDAPEWLAATIKDWLSSI